MEHSLHKQLKEIYCDSASEQEVVFGEYRIDVVDEMGTLIEIQHSSLSAIKKKCQHLLASNSLLVVKPIVRNKCLIKLDQKNGKQVSKRKSPKKGNWLSAFEELVYFTDVFPHQNLTMEFLLVDIEETRFPGHGRRYRRRESDFQVQDLQLVEIVDRTTIKSATDLFNWLPFESIPKEFDTGDLAEAAGISRPDAQRVTYCLRETGAIRPKGKRGRANLYERPMRRVKKSTVKKSAVTKTNQKKKKSRGKRSA